MKAFDPLRALRLLVDHDVEFVLIGGLAARLHGSPTVTDDLDISHEKQRSNLGALVRALNGMNARLGLPDPDERVELDLDWRLLHAADNVTFTKDFGALDCLAHPAGMESYEELSAGEIVMDLDGIHRGRVDRPLDTDEASVGPPQGPDRTRDPCGS